MIQNPNVSAPAPIAVATEAPAPAGAVYSIGHLNFLALSEEEQREYSPAARSRMKSGKAPSGKTLVQLAANGFNVASFGTPSKQEVPVKTKRPRAPNRKFDGPIAEFFATQKPAPSAKTLREVLQCTTLELTKICQGKTSPRWHVVPEVEERFPGFVDALRDVDFS